MCNLPTWRALLGDELDKLRPPSASEVPPAGQLRDGSSWPVSCMLLSVRFFYLSEFQVDFPSYAVSMPGRALQMMVLGASIASQLSADVRSLELGEGVCKFEAWFVTHWGRNEVMQTHSSMQAFLRCSCSGNMLMLFIVGVSMHLGMRASLCRVPAVK